MDRAVAEALGLIACDDWEPINFGSAGGPALIKKCSHDECYPAQMLGSVMGPVGGCPRYSTDLGIAMIHVWPALKRLCKDGGHDYPDLTFESDGRVVCFAVSGGDEYAPFCCEHGVTEAEAICRAFLAAKGAK